MEEKNKMMKPFCFLLLLGAVACMRQPIDHFVLKGSVPGAMDSTEVILRIMDNWVMALDTAYVVDGKFELHGKLDAPMLCRLSLDNSAILHRLGKDMNLARRYELDFFVENGNLSFSAPHIDSLPQAYWNYDIRKEKNYQLKGSVTQDAYYLYQQQTIPLRYEIQNIRRQSSQSSDYHSRLESMEKKLDMIGKTFIQENTNMIVKLYVADRLKKNVFTYDQTYLDELEELFASYQDTCAAFKKFRKYLHEASRFVKGSPLHDYELTDIDDKTVSLLSQVNQDGYTLIDFWASWCIPCRISLIHLREVYKQCKEKVRFISISIDQKKEDWYKAVQEENLPWLQFCIEPEQNKQIVNDFNLLGIPAFFLIDNKGRIIFSATNSGDVAMQLNKIK